MFQSILPFALLASTTFAQSNTSNATNTDETCPYPLYEFATPVNASSTVPVQHSNISSSGSGSGSEQPFYITVSLNDTRPPSAESADISITGFLSTPPNITGRACVHFLRTSSLLDAGTGENGDCSGSLSDRCVEFLTQNMRLSLSQGGTWSEQRCPGLPSREDVEEACGDPLGQGWTGASTTRPIDVSNSTCAASRVPGTVQPPENYDSRGLYGISGFSNDTSDRPDPSSFTWYDRYVSRPMPWVVSYAGEDGAGSWTSVVCVAPRNVSQGSREPSTGGVGRVNGAWTVVGALGVVAVMGML